MHSPTLHYITCIIFHNLYILDGMKFVAIPRQITACLSSYNYRYGAGSEFGREQREEARRKKYGINVKKYRPDDQPWILSAAGKSGKK